jgi:DNA-nicking Smr family endonuclease
VQAVRGGFPDLPALAAARARRPAALTTELPIEDSLDLHSFLPRDVPSVVDDYLHAAHARGFREVRLIHGRGIGVQRRIVQGLLRTHSLVAGFADAPEERGGRGATIVRMR